MQHLIRRSDSVLFVHGRRVCVPRSYLGIGPVVPPLPSQDMHSIPDGAVFACCTAHDFSYWLGSIEFCMLWSAEA